VDLTKELSVAFVRSLFKWLLEKMSRLGCELYDLLCFWRQIDSFFNKFLNPLSDALQSLSVINFGNYHRDGAFQKVNIAEQFDEEVDLADELTSLFHDGAL